jgi:hypothetical protein
MKSIKQHHRIITFALTIVSILLVTVMASGAAEVINPNEDSDISGGIQPSPFRIEAVAPLGNVINLPPASFTSDGYDPDGYFKFFGGGYFCGVVESGACVVATIQFPKTATTINKVYVYAYDFNTSAYEWFDLYRINLNTGATEMIGTVGTSDSAGVVRYTIPVSKRAILPYYAYQLATCTRPSIRVYGAKITYNE